MYRINSILKREAVTTYHNYQMPANQKILRKASALLARTQSANEHESALAASKFAEYMQRYNIQLSRESLMLAKELPELEDQVVAISRVADNWRKKILSGLADINACQLFWKYKTAYIEWHMIGRENRLDQIVFLDDYLEEAIERIVSAAQKTARQKKLSQGRAYWNAFRVGIATNIVQRLKADFFRRMNEGINDETRDRAKPATLNVPTSFNNNSIVSALVVQTWDKEEKQAVETYINEQNYSFKTVKGGSIRSVTGYNAGQNAGKNINLNQQLRSSSQDILPAVNS